MTKPVNTTDIFPPHAEKSKTLVKKGRIFTASLDATEKSIGDVAMKDVEFDIQMRTVLTALDAAMAAENWETVGESFCMLQDCELEYRKERYRKREH